MSPANVAVVVLNQISLFLFSLYRMVTPLRLGHLLASKLASLPGPTACQICRPASRKAFEWMSQRRSDTHPKQKQYEDMFEDDHDMDVVEAKLTSIIR